MRDDFSSLKKSLKDPGLVEPVLSEIKSLSKELGGCIKIMEVCGTHTVSLRQSGVHSLLPSNIRLISGPGCPVCVTPGGYIDNAIFLAKEKDVIVATFGDMLKVPGSDGDSLSAYTGSKRVRMVYSPAELPEIAAETGKAVVFLGIGFETTVPVIASVFLKARGTDIRNLYLYPAFKTVPIALKVLLADPERSLDALILPGHVSIIIGKNAYSFLEEEGGVPSVITGFEPVDMLYSILLILRQLVKGENRVENAYPRAVRDEGNIKAQSVVSDLLEPSDALWRGLGTIPQSGLSLRKEFGGFDAEVVFGLPPMENRDPDGCLCAEVIQGKVLPDDCLFFGGRCTPENPVGPCMVSSEGTCAAYFRYKDVK